MTITQTTTSLLFQSPGFTADRTEIAVYDLRGRRVLATTSTLSFRDDVPTHVVERSVLSHLSSGTYVAVASWAEGSVSDRI